MRVLLDTHALIWWATADPALSQTARDTIGDPTNAIFLSSVTPWEMAIKIAKGKLTLSVALDLFVSSQVSLYGFLPLTVTYAHAYRVGNLPLHHNDPFDRLLIAQATEENLILLSSDGKFAPYGVPVLW